MCKVHQRALSTMATLGEEIERLSQMRAWSWLKVRSRSRDHWRSRERGRKKDTTKLANLPTLRHHQAMRSPKVEMLIWGICQNWHQQWPPSYGGHQTHQTMRARRCCQSPLFWILQMGPVEGRKV